MAEKEEKLIPESLRSNWRASGIILDDDLFEMLVTLKEKKGESEYDSVVGKAFESAVRNAKSNKAEYFKKTLMSSM